MREWVLIRSILLLLLRICHPGLRKAVPPEPGVRKAVPPEPGVRKAAPPAFCFLPLTWSATDASMNCMQVPFWFSCNSLDHTLLRSTLTLIQNMRNMLLTHMLHHRLHSCESLGTINRRRRRRSLPHARLGRHSLPKPRRGTRGLPTTPDQQSTLQILYFANI